MLLGTETAARRIWSVRLNFSREGNCSVVAYISTTKSIAFCHAMRSLQCCAMRDSVPGALYLVLHELPSHHIECLCGREASSTLLLAVHVSLHHFGSACAV